jgi:hypothetical protein
MAGRSHLSRWLWFIALWLASVVCVGALAYGIRLILIGPG